MRLEARHTSSYAERIPLEGTQDTRGDPLVISDIKVFGGGRIDGMVAVRYFVTDVAQSIAFYECLGFEVEEQWGPAFAILAREDLRLWVSGPQTSAAHPMPDGRLPGPGGWNRIVITVRDLVDLIATLRKGEAKFRNDIVVGPGGMQIVLDDPDGNPIELFEARS